MSKNWCESKSNVDFIRQNISDATIIARKLNVPVENILGLAAEESNYGKGPFASSPYFNYFSMRSPAYGESGSKPAKFNNKVLLATYPDFLSSASSFAHKFGPYVMGKSEPKDFADALIKSHFNTGNSATGGRDGFTEYLIGIIHAVKERISC